MQTITISLPEQLYWQVKQRSPQNLRDVADQLLSAVSEALPAQEETAEFGDELAQLPFLGDEALWQAAQIQATPAENERMQQLLEKQKRVGLTTAEQEELTLLANFFRRIMVVRAEAAFLLSQRGHDIRPLAPTSR